MPQITKTHGEKDGYQFTLVENGPGYKAYLMQNPDGDQVNAKVFTPAEIQMLTDHPKEFWEKYCK